MAVNDVTTIITANMAGGDTTDRQPGSGVEELLLSIAGANSEGTVPDKMPAIDIGLIDGTNNGAVYQRGEDGDSAAIFFRAKMMADNTNYFRITHVGSSTDDYGFAVIAVG